MTPYEVARLAAYVQRVARGGELSAEQQAELEALKLKLATKG